MKIKEFAPNEFEELEKPWKALETGSEMTWFQTYEWYKILNKHFIDEKRKSPFRFGTYILILDDNDNPIFIAPIQVVKYGIFFKGIGIKKGFYFIGRQGYSDYLNFVYQDFNKDCIDLLFKYLKDKYKMNYFCFENVLSGTEIYNYLDTFENKNRIDSLCMRLELMDDFEAYRSTLAKSVKRNLTTAFNRAKKNDLEFSYEIVESLDDAMVEELRNIYLPRYNKKNNRTFSDMSIQARVYTKCRDAIVNYANVPIDVLTEIPKCWCLLIRCNGEIAAFFYDVYFPSNKTVYQLIAGIKEEYQWYGPGKTQLYSFIKDEIESGKQNVEVIDFTRGNESYKYDFASKETVTSQFSISL